MQTHTDKIKENKSRPVANALSQKQSVGESTFQFVDNRPEAIAQRKLQEMANNSSQVKNLAQLKTITNDKISDGHPIIQRKLMIGGLEYFNADHLKRLLMSDSNAGWKDEWASILETMIRSNEQFLSTRQLANYLDKISTGNPIEYIESMFVKNVVREVDGILSEVLHLIVSLPSPNVQATVEPLIIKFLKGNGTTTPPCWDKIGNYLETLKTVLSVVSVKIKDTIGGGAAKAETRAPSFPGHLGELNPTAAAIDLARSSDKGQHIPNMSTNSIAYDDMFAERVFTVLHELTHTAIGTLDKTNSLKGDARTAHKLKGPGSLKTESSQPNFTINADSWTILIFKIKTELVQEKTKLERID